MQKSNRIVLGWLLLAALWFLPLNIPHLFDPDEGRYGEIPHEMVASGDWVTPRLNGIMYFEKPALQYWATAAAYELFGEHAWTVRLWPALTGFLGLLLTWLLARRVYDTRTAALAVVIQGSAILYLAMARIATLDMALSFTLQLALAALVLLVHPPAPPSSAHSERARLAASGPAAILLGVGMALAVLTKGLVGILIPAAVGGLYMVLTRDWRLLLRAQPWWTLVALALIAAPWFIVVSVRNPGFAHFFFIHEHFERYLTRAHARYEPDWFFIPVLVLGFLPWTGLLPRTLFDAWRAARRGERVTTMLLIWAVFVFGFFSVSQSKLIPYIVPMLPALALLAARSLSSLPAERFARQLRALAVGTAALGIAILVAWKLPAAAVLVARASTGALVGFAAAFLLLALAAAVGAGLAARMGPTAAAVAAGCGGLLFVQLGLLAADALPRMRSVTELAQRLEAQVGPATHIYCVQVYVQPIPLYLSRPCTLVGYRGELDFGLTQEPQRWIADLPQFARRWQEESDAAAIVAPDALPQLQALGVPNRVIYTAPSFVLMVRR
jgi:4-amino-4-deoxy-L-arabinose transferase-like glycosyltransferase